MLAFGGLPGGSRVTVDPYRIHYEEVRLVGAFHHTPRHFRAALGFLASDAYPFERLVTHRVGLEGVAGRSSTTRRATTSRPPCDPVGAPAAQASNGRRARARGRRAAASRSTSTQPSPRASQSVAACGLTLCAARIAAAPRERRVAADHLEVARELLDRLDRPDPLDLDRDPAVVGVAAHQVDRARSRSAIRAARGAKAVLEHVRTLRERLLEVALDAVLLEPGVLAELVLELREHLGDPDLEPVLAPPPACGRRSRPSPSSTTVGGVIQLSGL